jgi:hypothetical protein
MFAHNRFVREPEVHTGDLPLRVRDLALDDTTPSFVYVFHSSNLVYAHLYILVYIPWLFYFVHLEYTIVHLSVRHKAQLHYKGSVQR